ncbi:hypothetical protein JB92DRAFT_2832124 [Gautieria morchelliformis]|nr:hypothetical protein JB92DRAFT_2832124 [Gautieria morchelliformis]
MYRDSCPILGDAGLTVIIDDLEQYTPAASAHTATLSYQVHQEKSEVVLAVPNTASTPDRWSEAVLGAEYRLLPESSFTRHAPRTHGVTKPKEHHASRRPLKLTCSAKPGSAHASSGSPNSEPGFECQLGLGSSSCGLTARLRLSKTQAKP